MTIQEFRDYMASGKPDCVELLATHDTEVQPHVIES